MARLVHDDQRQVESAFFFGTLMHPRILQRVIGNDGKHLTTEDANLVGYTRHHVRDADYPGVVPVEKGKRIMGRALTDDEASVRGTVVTGLTAADLDLLDEFEGDEYCRDIVPVNRLGDAPGAPPLQAWIYLWDSSLHRLAPSLWSYQDFARDKLSRWVQGSEEYAEVDRRRNLNGRTTPIEQIAFGHALRNQYWRFEPGWTNLNQGSYGSCPAPVIEAFRAVQDRTERAPDRFMTRELAPLLDGVRARLATTVNCEVDDLMVCLNATTGVNSILRSLQWREDDVILHYSTVYGACLKTLQYVVDSQPHLRLRLLEVPLSYPVSDDQLLERTKQAIASNTEPGKIRLALFDAITSTPGVRMPWERLCALFRERGILSLVDGAHAIGQIPVDLRAAQPDFFVSNCHKHLYAHRACAVLYVPRRGHFYQPTPSEPGVSSTSLVEEWAWTSTQDWSSICSIPAALDFRAKLGGEARIMQHNHELAVAAGKLMASILGTEVMENAEGSLTCAMANVRLPLRVRTGHAEIAETRNSMIDRLLADYKTYVSLYVHNDAWWVRVTGQVYLELSDFEMGAKALIAICRDLDRDAP